MSWQSNNLDLNSIEKLWLKIFLKIVQEKSQLYKDLLRTFKKTGINLIKNIPLFKSMPEKLEAVIKAQSRQLSINSNSLSIISIFFLNIGLLHIFICMVWKIFYYYFK